MPSSDCCLEDCRRFLSCVRAALNQANTEVTVDTRSLHWQRFSEVAYRHRVVPLAVAGLSNLGVATVSREVADELNDYVAGYALRAKFLADELIRLLGLLDAHGIPSLPYKGPALAASLYGDIGLRPSGDLDILVCTDDVIKTQKLLEASGYNLWGFPRGWQWRSYHFSFVRQDHNVLFQLHWRFQPPGFPFDLDVRDVFARSGKTELLGHSVPALSAEDLLIVLSVHAAKHLFDRLIWLCDIAQLIAAKNGLGASCQERTQGWRVTDGSCCCLYLATFFQRLCTRNWRVIAGR